MKTTLHFFVFYACAAFGFLGSANAGDHAAKSSGTLALRIPAPVGPNKLILLNSNGITDIEKSSFCLRGKSGNHVEHVRAVLSNDALTSTWFNQTLDPSKSGIVQITRVVSPATTDCAKISDLIKKNDRVEIRPGIHGMPEMTLLRERFNNCESGPTPACYDVVDGFSHVALDFGDYQDPAQANHHAYLRTRAPVHVDTLGADFDYFVMLADANLGNKDDGNGNSTTFGTSPIEKYYVVEAFPHTRGTTPKEQKCYDERPDIGSNWSTWDDQNSCPFDASTETTTGGGGQHPPDYP